VGIAALRVALLVASLLALLHAAAPAERAAPSYGRERVAEYEVPAELVARWRAQAEAGVPARSAESGWADPLQWIGPRQPAGAGRNPYTLVLTVAGTAPAAGDVRTHWQAGWEVQESPAASRDLLMPLAGLSSGRVAAGTPLTLTVVGQPVTFRGERQVAPMLGLVRTQNLEMQTVRLALWSGAAPWSWPQAAAPRPVLLLLAALCAGACWSLRPARAPSVPVVARGAAPTAAPAPDTLAEPPLPAPAMAALLAQPVVVQRPAAPPAAPAAPGPAAGHAARVVAALRDVLGNGPSVQNEAGAPRARGRNRGLRPG
jgi:hypothetical protein